MREIANLSENPRGSVIIPVFTRDRKTGEIGTRPDLKNRRPKKSEIKVEAFVRPHVPGTRRETAAERAYRAEQDQRRLSGKSKAKPKAKSSGSKSKAKASPKKSAKPKARPSTRSAEASGSSPVPRGVQPRSPSHDGPSHRSPSRTDRRDESRRPNRNSLDSFDSRDTPPPGTARVPVDGVLAYMAERETRRTRGPHVEEYNENDHGKGIPLRKIGSWPEVEEM